MSNAVADRAGMWHGLPKQFDLVSHYDVMSQLDADVHEDHKLSRTEAELAIRLVTRELGHQPRSVWLPCFGTGRHIEHLLALGVERIAGVDLSPACVAKAQARWGSDSRVSLYVADLSVWRTDERFDCGILLGNSFADVLDEELLMRVTRGMLAPIRPGGGWVMDYIGSGYCKRGYEHKTSTWDAVLNGRKVRDRRTPRMDWGRRVLFIEVVVEDAATGQEVWKGEYQKRVLDEFAVRRHFLSAGDCVVAEVGLASELNPEYYAGNEHELGMIASSTWWLGQIVLPQVQIR